MNKEKDNNTTYKLQRKEKKLSIMKMLRAGNLRDHKSKAAVNKMKTFKCLLNSVR